MDAIHQLKTNLQQRFNQLNKKEQYYLTVLAVLLLPYLVYMLLWQPLVKSNQQLLAANQIAQQQLQSVQQLAAQYKQLQKSANGANVDVNLPQLIDSSVARHNFVLKRMQPSSSGDIQLR